MDELNEVENNVNNTEVEVEAPEVEAPKAEPKREKSEKRKTDSNPNIEYFESKIENLEKALNAVRSENKRLVSENTSVKTENTTYKIEKLRTSALNEALANLGEDYEVPSAKLQELNDVISEYSNADTINDLIAKQVNLVKTPKQKDQPVIFNTPFNGSAASQTTKATSAVDLYKLAATDPEAFKKALKNQ